MRYEGTSGITVGHQRRDELSIRSRIVDRENRRGSVTGDLDRDSFDLHVEEHGSEYLLVDYEDIDIHGRIHADGFTAKFDRSMQKDDHITATRTATGYEGTFEVPYFDGISFSVDQTMDGPLGTRTGEFVQEDSTLHLEFRSRPLDALGGVRELALLTPDGSIISSLQLPGDTSIEAETAIAGYLATDFLRQHDADDPVIGPSISVVM